MLASRSSRLGASLLDVLLYVVPVMLAGMGAAFATFAMKKSFDSNTAPNSTPGAGLPPAAIGVAVVGVLAIIALWTFQAYRVSTTGQTLGKKWLAIRIVKMDDTPVNFVSGVLLRGILPWFLGIIPYLGFIFSLTDSLFIFGEQRRCLHDLLAGTKVVTA
jgi:uncharacterized RDD family membrane protein YckC